MSFTIKKDEKEARERLKAFWAGSSLGGRPALFIAAKKTEYVKKPWDRPDLDRKELDFLPEWHAYYNNITLESTEYLAEAMPSGMVSFAGNINMPSVLIGGEYDYHSAGNAWIKPDADLWDKPVPQFDPNHPIVKSLEKCYEKVFETVGDRGFVNPPVMLGPLSLLSELRTGERLCLDLYENPEKVKSWTNAVADVYIAAYDHFYTLIKSRGYGETSSWLQAMSEGRFEAMECDFGVMISPDMFKEFALPIITRFTEYFDNTLYHMDGTSQMRFLDLLSSIPRLNGIQWNPEPSAGSPVKWIDAFKEIRKRKLCLHIWCFTVDEAVELAKELGPDGLILVLAPLDSTAEAEKAIKRISSVC
jgi:hypothetical protein